MNASSLKLMVVLNANAFHPEGWKYDPVRKCLSRMGHDPGMDPYSKEVATWFIGDLAEKNRWMFVTSNEEMVPSLGWMHMPDCDCDDCVKGEHREFLPGGGYRIVTKEGVVRYEVPAGMAE